VNTTLDAQPNGALSLAEAVAHSLGDEIAGYRRLMLLLLDERDALRVADADSVAQIAELKLTEVQALHELSAARTRALAELGLPANAQGMEALLNRSTHPARARDEWNTLASLATDTQRQNNLNARILGARQRHIDRAMAALWAAAGRESTYGADGRSQHYSSPRTIASI
jgi:flagellar biosynthesis/type III secretory pathway chaperone